MLDHVLRATGHVLDHVLRGHGPRATGSQRATADVPGATASGRRVAHGGTDRALGGCMPINDFRQLRCWQLANDVRREVIAICATDAAKQDFKFCNSFRDAAGSMCRNIAEGFRRFESAQIVQFFRYALASLSEVQDHLEECRLRAFISDAEFVRLYDRTEHAKAMAMNFMKLHLAKTSHRDRGTPPDERSRRR